MVIALRVAHSKLQHIPSISPKCCSISRRLVYRRSVLTSHKIKDKLLQEFIPLLLLFSYCSALDQVFSDVEGKVAKHSEDVLATLASL